MTYCTLRRMASEEWLLQTRMLGKLVARSEPLKRLAEKRYDHVFASSTKGGMFKGVYATFDEAQRAAPPTRPSGYDNPDAAEMYRDRLDRVYPSDYPVLFWLDRLLADVSCVFDLGGHVGIARYGYSKYLDFRPDQRWLVYDVPAVVESGRRLAQERGVSGLDFTTSFSDAGKAELLFSAGALQYLPAQLPEMLRGLDKRPRYLLLNLLPLTDGAPYYTLQHIGNACCPYGILSRPQLLSELGRLGYELEDSWQNPDKSCRIPFHEAQSLDHYEGMLLVASET